MVAQIWLWTLEISGDQKLMKMQEWFDGTRPTFDENGRVRFYGKDLDGDGFNETDNDINGDGTTRYDSRKNWRTS